MSDKESALFKLDAAACRDYNVREQLQRAEKTK